MMCGAPRVTPPACRCFGGRPAALRTPLTSRHSRSLLPLQLITTPANVLSSMVVEGYKKLLLVTLITSGNAPSLPKYTSNSVSRHLKNYTSEYEALATSCQVRAVAQSSDCNMLSTQQL